MSDLTEPKNALREYLQDQRDALLWKLDGLGERDLRTPRTPTGTNLIGIVKHMANVEIGYFGDTFGREWPTPEERVPEEAYDTDPQADWYATEDETCDGIVDFYRRVWAFADTTIEELYAWEFDGPQIRDFTGRKPTGARNAGVAPAFLKRAARAADACEAWN